MAAGVAVAVDESHVGDESGVGLCARTRESCGGGVVAAVGEAERVMRAASTDARASVDSEARKTHDEANGTLFDRFGSDVRRKCAQCAALRRREKPAVPSRAKPKSAVPGSGTTGGAAVRS